MTGVRIYKKRPADWPDPDQIAGAITCFWRVGGSLLTKSDGVITLLMSISQRVIAKAIDISLAFDIAFALGCCRMLGNCVFARKLHWFDSKLCHLAFDCDGLTVIDDL